ncbi:MAG: hypothetical protein ACFFAH_08795 [Promethearchaeota archaeon]
MSYLQLEETTQLAGLISLIGCCFIFALVCLIFYIAINNRVKKLYLFAIYLLSLSSPWYPSGFGYLYWLLTGTIFDYELYVLLGTIGFPLVALCWFYIYTSIMYPNWKKVALIFFGILSIIFYSYVFYFLFFAPGAPVEPMIGSKITPLDIEYTGFIRFYIIVGFLIGAPTFFHFAISSMRTKNDPKIQLRGKLLLIASILYIFGAITDALFDLIPIYLIIIRSLLAIAALTFYMGFVMPTWVIKMFNLNIEE